MNQIIYSQITHSWPFLILIFSKNFTKGTLICEIMKCTSLDENKPTVNHLVVFRLSMYLKVTIIGKHCKYIAASVLCGIKHKTCS